MFNQKITVINRLLVNHEDTYNLTVVNGVFIDQNERVTKNASGLLNGDKALIIIPQTAQADKPFIEPKQYTASCWTLKKGDYIVEGEVTKFTTISALTETENVYKITSVDIKLFGSLPHYEVSCGS